MKEEKSFEKPVFLTQNPEMENLVQKIKLVAKTGATLLVTGENGTGKEVMAQLFHYHSVRTRKPMVTINCGAIPSELVESELFGHEKGAFTGAHARKKGCFERAHGGTLFLDEIGEMPKPMQVKLLRAVELGSFRRVGGSEEIKVDVSLISATNKILTDQVKSGNFREDLYYRINVIELYVPPLRHRKEDIPLLVSHFAHHFAQMYKLDELEFSDECMNVFLDHDWPGNVRELRNIVERCIVLSDGDTIDLSSLPSHLYEGKKKYPVTTNHSSGNIMQIPVGTDLKEVERRIISETLHSVDNNKTEAAKILNIARKTLHNKLEKYETERTSG